jgi:uncharacterized protein (TIRG00374 family)
MKTSKNGIGNLLMTIDLKTNNGVKFFFIIAITIVIFFLIFQKINFNEVISIVISANKFYILLSIIPLGVSLFFNAIRWRSVLSAMGYEITLKECFVLFMAAIPFSSITPSKSGDIVRAYYLKNKIPITHTVGSVITERIFDLAVLLFFSLIGIYFSGAQEFALIIIFFMFLLGMFMILTYNVSKLPISETWSLKIQSFFISVKDLIENRRKLLSVIVSSFSIWILAILQTMLLFSALSITVPPMYIIGTLPIAIVIGMIPVTLGGMGTRDAAIIMLFSGYATSSQLLAVALLFSLFRYWLLAIVGLPFMRIALKNQ